MWDNSGTLTETFITNTMLSFSFLLTTDSNSFPFSCTSHTPQLPKYLLNYSLLQPTDSDTAFSSVCFIIISTNTATNKFLIVLYSLLSPCLKSSHTHTYMHTFTHAHTLFLSQSYFLSVIEGFFRPFSLASWKMTSLMLMPWNKAFSILYKVLDISMDTHPQKTFGT